MSLKVTTNVASLSAQRSLTQSQRRLENNSSQLASGRRINRAADDAAGLAISERFRSQIRATRQAGRNANDAVSMVQVAEGGLNEIGNIIVRLRELSVQASTDTIGPEERSYIDEEVQGLKLEIDRISKATKWRSDTLLDGSLGDLDFQVGIATSDADDRIGFDTGDFKTTLNSLNIGDVHVLETSKARESLRRLDSAQQNVNRVRAHLGGLQRRLTSTIDNLSVAEENRRASNSRFRDTDVGEVASDLVRDRILIQASTATLAQANQVPSQALQLLE